MLGLFGDSHSEALKERDCYVLELRIAKEVLAQIANALAVEFGLVELDCDQIGLFNCEFHIGAQQDGLTQFIISFSEPDLELWIQA